MDENRSPELKPRAMRNSADDCVALDSASGNWPKPKRMRICSKRLAPRTGSSALATQRPASTSVNLSPWWIGLATSPGSIRSTKLRTCSGGCVRDGVGRVCFEIRRSQKIKTAPISRGRIGLNSNLRTTSFSSEQPFSLQAPFSSLRSSSIDSPFTSNFASLERARLCPLYKVVSPESQEKNATNHVPSILRLAPRTREKLYKRNQVELF
jgi:hypothetical protein